MARGLILTAALVAISGCGTVRHLSGGLQAAADAADSIEVCVEAVEGNSLVQRGPSMVRIADAMHGLPECAGATLEAIAALCRGKVIPRGPLCDAVTASLR